MSGRKVPSSVHGLEVGSALLADQAEARMVVGTLWIEARDPTRLY